MPSSFELINDLRTGKESIGVIGAGFIGTSTALYYAHEGVKSVVYDVDPAKIDRYKKGECDVINLESWSGMSLKEFVVKGMITPTNNFEDIKNVKIFFVAVPTERGGEPLIDYVKKVLEQLIPLNPKLILIESTLAPNWVKELGLNNLPVCVATRRDWFSNPNCTLKTLTRIYCAATPELDKLSNDLMSIVTINLRKASSMEVSSLVKAIENAIWHVELVAVQELAMIYDLDVDEILQHVATHPQRMRWYANIKVGGYCVPLGAKYVRDSADHPENLRLFTAAIEQNERTPVEVVKKLVEKVKPKVVGVLGITYKNDLRVHTLSPGIAVITELKKLGITVLVNDIFYSEKEIDSITGCKWLNYPEDMKVCDLVIVTIDHKKYYETPVWDIMRNIKKDAVIVDNLGVWNRYKGFLKNYYQFSRNFKM